MPACCSCGPSRGCPCMGTGTGVRELHLNWTREGSFEQPISGEDVSSKCDVRRTRRLMPIAFTQRTSRHRRTVIDTVRRRQIAPRSPLPCRCTTLMRTAGGSGPAIGRSSRT